MADDPSGAVPEGSGGDDAPSPETKPSSAATKASEVQASATAAFKSVTGRFRKPKGDTEAERVQDQVSRQAGLDPTVVGGGSLFDEPVLVVNQKMKVIELTNEYFVFDAAGTRIGAVAEVGQGNVKKAARFISSLDQFMTHAYEIRDAADQVVMRLVRPRKIMKSKFTVELPDGSQFGAIKQNNVFGKIRFGLEVGGETVGEIRAENWKAWDFHIRDNDDREVARITKTWEGIGKTLFTTADNYAVELKEGCEGPLRTMAVVAALCIDTALKQDDRGLN